MLLVFVVEMFVMLAIGLQMSVLVLMVLLSMIMVQLIMVLAILKCIL